MGSDLAREYYWPVVNKEPIGVWLRYFFSRPKGFFWPDRMKIKKIGFLEENFSNPEKVDPTPVKIFAPNPSLTSSQISNISITSYPKIRSCEKKFVWLTFSNGFLLTIKS